MVDAVRQQFPKQFAQRSSLAAAKTPNRVSDLVESMFATSTRGVISASQRLHSVRSARCRATLLARPWDALARECDLLVPLPRTTRPSRAGPAREPRPRSNGSVGTSLSVCPSRRA